MKHLTRKLVTLMCTIAIALAAIPMGMAFAATLSDAPQTMAQYQAPDSDGKTVYIQFKTFWANYLNIDKTEMDFTLVYESEIYPMSAEDTTDKKVCFNNVPNGTYSVYCNDEDTGKKLQSIIVRRIKGLLLSMQFSLLSLRIPLLRMGMI